MSGVISPDLGLAAPGGASFNPLKRRNTQIPEQAAAEHPTPTSATTGHGTTYRMDPMMTEHLALIGFAARLGTSLTSDAAEASATRNDAQLLMGMLSSRHGHKPTSSDECAGRPPLDEACCGKFMSPARLSVLIVFFPRGGHMFLSVYFVTHLMLAFSAATNPSQLHRVTKYLSFRNRLPHPPIPSFLSRLHDEH